MASYRYERDIDPKDLKPRKQRQYTRKERWANWWDYNLKWVIILGILVAFFGYNDRHQGSTCMPRSQG